MSVSSLPTEHCNKAIEEIARDEGFESFRTEVSQGSKDGDNYMSEIFRVVIDGVKDGRHQRLSLILKVSLKNPLMRENSFIQKFFLREVYAYTTMLPILNKMQKNVPDDEKFLFPKLYKTVVEEDDELLVMEDMLSNGYVMLDRMKSFNYEELVVCVKNLARYHATSIVLRAKYPKIYEEMTFHGTKLEDLEDALTQLLTKNLPTVRELIKNEAYEDTIGSVMDNLMDLVTKPYYDFKTDPYTVLCHGDSWTNNFFFKYKEGVIDKMVILDWQMFNKGAPILDLTYVLLIGLDSEMRTKHYEEMVDLYYETLSTSVENMGVEMAKHYPETAYREHVKKYMKFGLYMSFGILPVTLGKKGDNDIITLMTEGNSEDNWKKSYSEVCGTRMKELFADCIKFKIL